MSMNLNDGNLKELSAAEIAKMLKDEGILGPHERLVDLDDATTKQQKDMQVSLRDHTSTLGKKLTNERRKLRRKGKLK